MTRAVMFGAVVACLLACSSAARATTRHTYAFGVTSASMSEVVSFQGDGGPACQRAGVCGYSGTLRYSFDHADGLAIFLIRGRRVVGTGEFFFDGLTTATVQGPGGGPPCTDKELERFDGFEVEGTAARMRMVFHPAFDNPYYLVTFCGGPTDIDIAEARGLPQIPLTPRTLRHDKVHLQASSSRSFHTGPFVGTVTFNVNIRMRRSRFVTDIRNFLL